MLSEVDPQFWKLFDRLPAQVQMRADISFKLWQLNPSRRSFHLNLLTRPNPFGRCGLALIGEQLELGTTML